MLRNKVLINLQLEEIEDEEFIIDQVMTKEVHDMFQSRKKEGFFSILWQYCKMLYVSYYIILYYYINLY